MNWTALARLRRRQPHISRNARLFLWTVFLSNVGVSGIFLLLYNLYLVALGYHEDFIGLLSLIQTGAIAVGALPSGSLAERFGPRRILVAGTLVLGIGALGQCLVTAPAALALLNVVTGIGLAMRIVPYTPYLVDNTSPGERTLVFSANSAAISIAGTAGSLIGGQLPALFAVVFLLSGAESLSAFRLSLAVGAIIGILATIPMAMATDAVETPNPAKSTPPTPATPAPAPTSVRRNIGTFVLVTILFAFSGAAISPFVNVYFNRVLGFSPSSISFIMATSSLLAAVATVGIAAAADRIGKARAMVLVRIGGVPLMLLLSLHPAAWLGVMAIMARNITEMAGWPLDGAFLAEVIPLRRQARAVALRSVAWNGTWALTSFVAGLVIVRLGYQPLFAVASLTLLGATFVYYLAFVRRRPSRTQPPPLR